MVTALYCPESSKIEQKDAEDLRGLGKARVEPWCAIVDFIWVATIA